MTYIPELEVVSIPADKVRPGMVLAPTGKEPHVVDEVSTAGNNTSIVVFDNNPSRPSPESLLQFHQSFEPVQVLVDRNNPGTNDLGRFLWHESPEVSRQQRQADQSASIAALVGNPTPIAERWMSGPTPSTPRLPVDRGYER